MKSFNAIIHLATLFIPLSLFAQEIDYFPAHVGDSWQYRVLADNSLVYTRYVDSIIVDPISRMRTVYGRNINGTATFNVFKRDTSDFVYQSFQPQYPRYKLSAVLGDKWIVGVQPGPDTVYVTATVVQFYTTRLFGTATSVKAFRFTIENKPPRVPFVLGTDYLADQFGLVRSDPEPGNIYVLSGAIINGKQYGVITSVEKENRASDEDILLSNYPNPFNGSTTIHFRLPKKAYVDLSVFDILGRKVMTLIEGIQEAGKYNITCNCGNLPSGTFIYRISTSNKVVTNKFLHIK